MDAPDPSHARDRDTAVREGLLLFGSDPADVPGEGLPAIELGGGSG